VISVVIPSWNGRELLRTCIDALNLQTCRDFEVIVVDNGSTDSTLNWLKENHPHVRCVALPKNEGFSGAVNRGIDQAKGEYIALLNNDTRVAETWLEKLSSAVVEFPEYSIFASKILMMDHPNRIDTAGDGFTVAGFGYKRGWLNESSEMSTPQRIFGASGCAALYDRKVFDRIGQFDEAFFAFAEDLDISFRALNAGFRCIFIPDAIVYHKVRATAAPEKTFQLYHRNLTWLLYKNLPGRLWLFYLPDILMNWCLVAVRSIRNRMFLSYLKSLAMGFRGIPSMRMKRTHIKRTRTASIQSIRDQLDRNWIKIHWQLMISKRRFTQGLQHEEDETRS
jgi:GT2 family glycosyltransferase